MFYSKCMYDLCFRAVQGLPLPQRILTCLLIESIMARLMRAQDICVCSYVWMSNHPHIQLFSLDIMAMSHFHEGLKKRLTDFLKRLLGLKRLRLWDDRTTVAQVLDLESAIKCIAYAYLNPVRAKLVRSIDFYEGCNTWKEFLAAPADVNAVIEKEVVWIQATDLDRLSSANPGLSEERTMVQRLLERARGRKHTLRIYPFKWLEVFGVKRSEDIEEVRQRIIALVRAGEAECAEQKSYPRRIEGFVVTDAYLPKKKDRKVLMYGSTKEIRWRFLRRFRHFVDSCRQCYELMKQGVKLIPWPPACFIPPAPKGCNVFPT